MRNAGLLLLLAVTLLPLSACDASLEPRPDNRSPETSGVADAASPPDTANPPDAFRAGSPDEDGDTGDAGNAGERVAFRTVASQKTLPQDFDRIAWTREQVPHLSYLVRKVDDTTQYEEAWTLFRLEGDRAAVDFEQDTAWFIGLHESGSCPMTLADMRVDAARRELRVSVTLTGSGTAAGTGGVGCTSDATPRTFVVTMAKRAVRDVERVVIEDSGTETAMPVNAQAEASDFAGRFSGR